MDETPIPQITDEPNAKAISPPPKFKFTANDKPFLPPPNGTTARASTPKSRGRPRGSSPVKNASPAKSTKKARASKKDKEAEIATAREASATLHSNLDDATSATSAPSESADGDKAIVSVVSNIEKHGDTETATTSVKIAMPQDSAAMPLPEDPTEMIEKAKQMVEEARKMDGESSSSASKRKADELDDESEEEGDSEQQPAKKAKLLEQTLKVEKVRNRAMLGVAVTMALG